VVDEVGMGSPPEYWTSVLVNWSLKREYWTRA
jgi:hypothetical protein